MQRIAAFGSLALLFVLAACDKGGGGEAQEPAGSETLSNAECDDRGGVIVGDIGNGAIFKPDYTCENGQPPIARIVPGEGEPIASEGAVCCGG